MTTPRCRHCGHDLTVSLVDLGDTPLANAYVPAERAHVADPLFELHARLCTSCLLVQVRDAVDPSEIFSDYAYFSSYSTTWLEHARRFADDSAARFDLGPGDLVAEIASNDGYLLKNYLAQGIDVVGIEPAHNVAQVAIAEGVETEVAFFGEDLAQDLVGRGKRPRLIVGNNVFAHVPDINDFARGLALLAADDGVVVLEFPHLARLLAETQFDTIYHEHFSYLSLAATESVLGSAGLSVFDIEHLPTHGGSLRVYAAASGRRAETPAVEDLRLAEKEQGLHEPGAYEAFGTRVAAIRDELLSFLSMARTEGHTVAAYGAAAKGNTLLNYCGVDAGDVACVADRSPHKQGMLMPGSRIPIVAPDALEALCPDYVLILPWNLRDEIIGQLSALSRCGTQFVTAVPELAVTS